MEPTHAGGASAPTLLISCQQITPTTSLRQPNRVPEWIVAHSLHQTSTQRVGDDVPRSLHQTLFPMKRSVMEARHPNRSRSLQRKIDGTRGSAFGYSHHIGKLCVSVQLHQSMPVIRHQNPAQQARSGPAVGTTHDRCRNGCALPVREQSLSVLGDGGQQIEPTRLGPASASQRLVTGMIACIRHDGSLPRHVANRCRCLLERQVGKPLALNWRGNVGGASAPTLLHEKRRG